eukprot:IDg7755t1
MVGATALDTRGTHKSTNASTRAEGNARCIAIRERVRKYDSTLECRLAFRVGAEASWRVRRRGSSVGVVAGTGGRRKRAWREELWGPSCGDGKRGHGKGRESPVAQCAGTGSGSGDDGAAGVRCVDEMAFPGGEP